MTGIQQQKPKDSYVYSGARAARIVRPGADRFDPNVQRVKESRRRDYGNITDGSGITHSSLAGLSSDDHPQYLLASGSRSLAGNLTINDGFGIVAGSSSGLKIATATTQKIAFYNSAPVVQQTDGAALTNSVTVGGTTNTIANYTDLVTYANDAAAIRNNIYQLARKLKIVDDALRTYGLLS